MVVRKQEDHVTLLTAIDALRAHRLCSKLSQASSSQTAFLDCHSWTMVSSKAESTHSRGTIAVRPKPKPDAHWNLQTVAFEVAGVLFSVPKHGFLVKGTPFETTFSLPPPDPRNVEGSSSDNPIVLEGVSANDFRAFLRALYPLGVPPITSYTDWIRVLSLSDRWEFVKIRRKAIDSLKPLMRTKSADVKIQNGKQYRVKEWLRDGLEDLVTMENLCIQDLRQKPYSFDLESIAKIFYIRSQAWQAKATKPPGTFVFGLFVTLQVSHEFRQELSRATHPDDADAPMSNKERILANVMKRKSGAMS